MTIVLITMLTMSWQHWINTFCVDIGINRRSELGRKERLDADIDACFDMRQAKDGHALT